MSAASSESELSVNRDLSRLAPSFAASVRKALEECNAGLDGGKRAFVFEGYRSDALQALYYKKGRSVIPPRKPVTKAPTNLHSWHGYGLAVDVIHREKLWNPPGGTNWFAEVAEIFEKHGCIWGGRWKDPDWPHFQWKHCTPSPTDSARVTVAAEGVAAIWLALKASDGTVLAGNRNPPTT